MHVAQKIIIRIFQQFFHITDNLRAKLSAGTLPGDTRQNHAPRGQPDACRTPQGQVSRLRRPRPSGPATAVPRSQGGQGRRRRDRGGLPHLREPDDLLTDGGRGRGHGREQQLGGQRL